MSTGMTTYLRFRKNTIDNFTITERPYEAGDLCSMPKTAQEGNNNYTTLDVNQWFEYTAKNSGLLKMEYPMNLNTFQENEKLENL